MKFTKFTKYFCYVFCVFCANDFRNFLKDGVMFYISLFLCYEFKLVINVKNTVIYFKNLCIKKF